MKGKSLISAEIFLLSMLILMSFASATLSFSSSTLTLDKSVGTHTSTINLTSTEAETETVTFNTLASISDGNSHSITFSPISSLSFSNETKQVSITYNVPSNFEFGFNQAYTRTLTADGTISADNSVSLVFQTQNDFCSGISSAGGLDIEIDDINNNGKFGDEDNWYPLDTIEVKVFVENTGSNDIKNIKLKWALYSDSGKEVMHGTETSFKLNDDSDKTVSFNFTLDKNVDEFNSETYTLYVSASGTVGDNSDTKACVDDSITAEMNIDDDLVVLSNIEMPESISCGTDLHIIGTAWNIGSSSEDNVYVIVKSSDLGINKRFDLGDIDELDSQDFDFTISIPKNITAKTYGLDFTVYNEDDDIFQSDDNEDSKFTLVFPVSGDCLGSLSASVTGEVQSGGEAGKELVVNLTIKNTGKLTSTFTLSATNYNTWADSLQIDQPLVTLGAGESKTVLLTFAVKQGISGDNSFNVGVYSNSNLVTSQPFAVTIKEKSHWYSFDFGNLADKFGGKWYLWVIGAINILLIVIIIVVAVKVARK